MSVKKRAYDGSGTETPFNFGEVEIVTAYGVVDNDDLATLIIPFSDIEKNYETSTLASVTPGNLVRRAYCDSDTGDLTVNLTTRETKEFITIKKVGTDSNNIILTPTSGLIEGETSITIGTLELSLDLSSDGTNWYIH